jgi:hypothetical protein
MASWRDVLPIHPACELFPPLPPDELRALGEDIVKNKLASPIVLWQADSKAPLQLLDGRNRLDALELVAGPVTVGAPSIMAGEDFLACDRVITLPKSVDPYAYVISANIRRRHLSIEDKDRLIVQLLKADPTKSNRTVAKLTDTSHPHVAKVREQAEKTGDVETVTTSIDAKGRRQPTRKSKPPVVSQEMLQRRAAATERLRDLPDIKSHNDTEPKSAGETTREDARSEEARHFESQNIALRSEVAELKTKVRDLEDRTLRAASIEKLLDELERRPEAVFFKRHLTDIRRVLDATGRHLDPTLEPKAVPATDSAATKH